MIKFIDKYISCTQSNSDYFYQFHKHKKCCKIFQHDNNKIKEFDIEKFIDSRTQDNGKESYIETAYRNETFFYKMTKTILDYIEKLNIISYIKEIGLCLMVSHIPTMWHPCNHPGPPEGRMKKPMSDS